MAVIVPFLIGVVAGLRTMTAPAAVAWAGWLAWLELAGTWAAFLASPWAVGILTALALGEFVTAQLPTTPSRKVPVQLAGRVASGAFPARHSAPPLAACCSVSWRGPSGRSRAPTAARRRGPECRRR